MLRFRRLHSLQKFSAVHSSVQNHFNTERSLSSRPVHKLNRAAPLAEWGVLCAARDRANLPKERRVHFRLTAPLRMLMKRHGRPKELVTDKPRSYGAALEVIAQVYTEKILRLKAARVARDLEACKRVTASLALKRATKA